MSVMRGRLICTDCASSAGAQCGGAGAGHRLRREGAPGGDGGGSRREGVPGGREGAAGGGGAPGREGGSSGRGGGAGQGGASGRGRGHWAGSGHRAGRGRQAGGTTPGGQGGGSGRGGGTGRGGRGGTGREGAAGGEGRQRMGRDGAAATTDSWNPACSQLGPSQVGFGRQRTFPTVIIVRPLRPRFFQSQFRVQDAMLGCLKGGDNAPMQSGTSETFETAWIVRSFCDNAHQRTPHCLQSHCVQRHPSSLSDRKGTE